MSKYKFNWEECTLLIVVILCFASCQMDRNRKHDIEKIKIENGDRK